MSEDPRNTEDEEINWVNILVGDQFDTLMEALLGDYFNAPEFNLYTSYCFCSREVDIISAAAHSEFDFAVLVLNNIHYINPEDSPRNSKIEAPLRLISLLSKGFKIPVIALYTHPRHADIPARVIMAGASWVATLPMSSKTFIREVGSIMAMDRET